MTTANKTDSTTTRFSLIEMDDAPKADAPTPAPVPGRDIVESARAAAANERALVQDITGIELSAKGMGMDGFSTPGGLVYDEGTKMLDSGVAVALASRTEWDALPLATVAAAEHAATIAAEGRKDYREIKLSNLVVDHEGHLTRANGGLRFSDWSWGQVRGMAPRGTALRNNFNSWMRTSDYVGTFRTRYPDSETRTRELFAAVSDKYAVNDGHEVLSMVADQLPGMTRGRISYDADTTRVEADMTIHNPYELEDDIAVGRLHRMGLRYTTRDDGGERHRLRLYAERIACINCTLIPFDIAGIERVHVGDPAQIWQDIAALVARSADIMGQFADHWQAAHVTRVFNGTSMVDEAQAMFGRLVDGGFIDANGTSKKVLVERLVAAWADEPGNTYQAINRAITRAAHGFDWATGTSDDLEDQAGVLLYQRVQVLNSLGMAA